MAYYTPTPEAVQTAAFGRALLGILTPSYRASRFSIPAPVVMARAAQTAAAIRAATAAENRLSLMMSGMGLGILPSVNVRYAKTAIPAALASREWNRLHPPRLEGLGKVKATIVPSGPAGMMVRRQPGFFMGPGGGPSSGPFTFPGYLSGLGDPNCDSGMPYDVSGNPCPNYGSASNPIVLGPGTPSISTPGIPDSSTGTSNAPTLFSDNPFQVSPYASTPASAMAPAIAATAAAAAGAPSLLRPGQQLQPATRPFLTQILSSSVLPFAAVGLGALLLLRGGKRRRRNPARRRNRRR